MPPQKQPAKPAKKDAKTSADPFFGMKNKKAGKNQKLIQQFQKQAQNQVKPKGPTRTERKEEKKKELDELNAIFRPVAQKVERAVDPKSVLCAFFKQGQCGKGDKCKFSHDLRIEKKAQKKSVYVDVRDDAGEPNEGGMENWDDDTLRAAVEKKHGTSNKASTEIICKHFIEALENNKYGWFWECPGGGDNCKYRHALPPGFVLQKDKKKADQGPVISMEELVEVERSKLAPDLPKLTLESFVEWKKRKIEERKAALAQEQSRKRTEYNAGRHIGLSGRDMFTFNPELAADAEMDEDEAAFDDFCLDDDDEDTRDLVDLARQAWAVG